MKLATFCVEQAADCIFWLDPEGRIIFANQKACDVLEYSREELQAMTVFEIDPVVSRESWGSHWEALQAKRSSVIESRHRTRAGRTFPVEIAVNYMTCDGKEYNCAFARDITERMNAQQSLRQSSQALQRANQRLAEALGKADAANRTKSEFLANMSHEIRTPMTAIIGYSDVLLDSARDQDTVEAVQIIKRNGHHLLNLINDILDLSKIEAGKHELHVQACSPRQLVSDVLSTMQVRADAKGLRLSAECEAEVPVLISTDPTHVRQILVNLIGNAIKFTEVGSVRVIARLGSTFACEGKLIFDVIDTGIGISEGDMDRLFQPFSQVDGSVRRRFGGSGLGLAICKRLAGALGGDIAVRSDLGRGSTFSLSIGIGPVEGMAMPKSPRVSAAVPEPVNIARQGLDCRILLAEDGPDNQRLIAFLLRKAGAEVEVAENGQTARECALAAQEAGSPFDVILMDMQMPVMDGYEATQKLRSAGYREPILALTAHAMSGDRQKCLDAGCDDYITKPIDPQKLVEMIGRWVATEPLTVCPS